MTEPSPHLSIGEVLGLLQQDFPDVTISKIRFLESQGLIDPERTPSGYRKFYDLDIERLRWILHQQRENFLPLKVIKDRLENGGPLGDQPSEAEEPAEPEELVEVVVGSEVLEAERLDSEREPAHAPAAEATLQPGPRPSWQDDPTMEFDFAALSAEVAASGHLTPPTPPSPDVATTDHATADDLAIEHVSAEQQPIDEATTGDPGGEDTPTEEAFELSSPSEPAIVNPSPVAPGVVSAAAPPPVTEQPSEHEQPQTTDGSPQTAAAQLAADAGIPDARDLDEAVEPAPADTPEQPNPWGLADLDGALANAGRTPATPSTADVDLVELEGRQPSPDTGGDTDTEAGSVTERLRRGDLGESDEPVESADAPAAVAEAETTPDTPDSIESAEVDPGASSTTRRPAVERYFSSEYTEPMGAMAMTVEELANHASLTVSQIRELEHFGIIVGESVGPDVIYDEESLAVAQAASTFLERGIEPRHLRQFAMSADREVSLYEQLALPVIRRRDPGTRTEADILLGSLYASGTELRSLLVKRGIRSTFGR